MLYSTIYPFLFTLDSVLFFYCFDNTFGSSLSALNQYHSGVWILNEECKVLHYNQWISKALGFHYNKICRKKIIKGRTEPTEHGYWGLCQCRYVRAATQTMENLFFSRMGGKRINRPLFRCFCCFCCWYCVVHCFPLNTADIPH